MTELMTLVHLLRMGAKRFRLNVEKYVERKWQKEAEKD